MFRLSEIESANLRLQIATSSSSWGGRRYWPLAFTREGVGMLSSVLRSPRGVEVNIAIMRAFVRMCDTLTGGEGLAARIEKAERALLGLENEQSEHAAAIRSRAASNVFGPSGYPETGALSSSSRTATPPWSPTSIITERKS